MAEPDQPMEMTEESKIFSLDLLTLIKSAQNQNGLRHNDYARYH
jgi:hypothetical protein